MKKSDIEHLKNACLFAKNQCEICENKETERRVKIIEDLIEEHKKMIELMHLIKDSDIEEYCVNCGSVKEKCPNCNTPNNCICEYNFKETSKKILELQGDKQ